MPAALQERRWYARSVADSDAHFGLLADDGLVDALCGRIFRPEINPYVCQPVGLVEPADRQHACPTCWRRRQDGSGQ